MLVLQCHRLFGNLTMAGLLRNLILSTLLLPTLLAIDVGASTINTADTCLIVQDLSAECSFQPSPPGVPERRLSGGTR